MNLFSLGRNKKPDYIDIHSHISEGEYDSDRGAVVDRMRYSKTRTITVGFDLESSRKAVEVANGFAEVYSCVGLHPTDTKNENFDKEAYKDLVWNIDTVAIGECGLDYFRIDSNDEEEKNRQKSEFIKQVDFAVEVNLPLMIHSRPSNGSMDSYLDILEILEGKKKEYKDKLRGNVHFFVGDKEIAKRFIDINFTCSFTGVITFTKDYDEVVKLLPLNMIQAETDSPYVTPEPHRGKRNEPVHVRAVVKRIAELKGEDEEKVRVELIQNAYRVFDLKN